MTDEQPDQQHPDRAQPVGAGDGSARGQSDDLAADTERGAPGPAEGSFARQLADTLGGPPFTGDPAVDAALAGAAQAADQEPADQLEVYVGTHRALQDRLSDSGA